MRYLGGNPILNMFYIYLCCYNFFTHFYQFSLILGNFDFREVTDWQFVVGTPTTFFQTATSRYQSSSRLHIRHGHSDSVLLPVEHTLPHCMLYSAWARLSEVPILLCFLWQHAQRFTHPSELCSFWRGGTDTSMTNAVPFCSTTKRQQRISIFGSADCLSCCWAVHFHLTPTISDHRQSVSLASPSVSQLIGLYKPAAAASDHTTHERRFRRIRKLSGTVGAQISLLSVANTRFPILPLRAWKLMRTFGLHSYNA